MRDVEKLFEGRANPEFPGSSRVGGIVEILRHLKRRTQHRPFDSKLIERHDLLGPAADHELHAHVRGGVCFGSISICGRPCTSIRSANGWVTPTAHERTLAFGSGSRTTLTSPDSKAS